MKGFTKIAKAMKKVGTMGGVLKKAFAALASPIGAVVAGYSQRLQRQE